MYRVSNPSTAGTRRTAEPTTGCRLSARTVTTRIICSPWAIRARVRPVRTSPAASCSATIWGKPIRPTSTSPSRAMSVDLLVFGPHPDDIEIGCGASVARHAALGLRVGLCDLTAGEMSSNGTVDERLREADAASRVLGAAWRDNLRWPDRRIGKEPAHLEHAVTFIRKHRPRVVAAPYWSDRHPDHGPASAVIAEAVFNPGLRRYAAGGEPWKVEWICYSFINDNAPPSFVLDCT